MSSSLKEDEEKSVKALLKLFSVDHLIPIKNNKNQGPLILFGGGGVLTSSLINTPLTYYSYFVVFPPLTYYSYFVVNKPSSNIFLLRG